VGVASSGAEEMHFGIPASVLRANDIDIEIMYQLPDEMRQEQLSMINYQPP
jgi:hypothetical protein